MFSLWKESQWNSLTKPGLRPSLCYIPSSLRVGGFNVPCFARLCVCVWWGCGGGGLVVAARVGVLVRGHSVTGAGECGDEGVISKSDRSSL